MKTLRKDFYYAIVVNDLEPVVILADKDPDATLDQHLGRELEEELGDKFINAQESMYHFDGTVAEAHVYLQETLQIPYDKEFEEFLFTGDCNPATPDMDMRCDLQRKRNREE